MRYIKDRIVKTVTNAAAQVISLSADGAIAPNSHTSVLSSISLAPEHSSECATILVQFGRTEEAEDFDLLDLLERLSPLLVAKTDLLPR